MIIVFILLFYTAKIQGQGDDLSLTFGEEVSDRVKDITNIRARFLVSVGEAWNDCNATVSTMYLKPGQNSTTAPDIQVADCDHGPLFYNIVQDTTANDFEVTVTFGTHAISAIPPPSCTFNWKGDYQIPTEKEMKLSPLLGCYVQVSYEGHRITDFIFQLLMWQWF